MFQKEKIKSTFFTAIFSLLLCFNSVISQVKYSNDSVSLKNGSLIKGKITTINLDSSVTISTIGGSRFVFNISEVENITVKTDTAFFKNGSILINHILEIIPYKDVKSTSPDGSVFVSDISELDRLVLIKETQLFSPTEKSSVTSKDSPSSTSKYFTSGFGIRSVGGRLGLLFPEDPIDNTIGLGLNTHLGTIIPKVELFGYLDYWSQGGKSGYSESNWSQFCLAAIAKYQFQINSQITPYAGGGIGFNISKWSYEVNYPGTYYYSGYNYSGSDSEFDIAFHFVGGASFPVSAKIDAFGELKYTTGGFKNFGIFAGLNYYITERMLKAFDYEKDSKKSDIKQINKGVTYSESKKKKVYSAKGAKSSGTATVLSVILPGAGHVYAGEINTGMSIMVIYAGAMGLVIAYGPWTWEEEQQSDLFPELAEGTGTPTSTKVIWYASAATAAITWLYAVIDSGPAVKRYNKRLKLGFNPIDNKGEIHPKLTASIYL